MKLLELIHREHAQSYLNETLNLRSPPLAPSKFNNIIELEEHRESELAAGFAYT
jgi:hypothetical protein